MHGNVQIISTFPSDQGLHSTFEYTASFSSLNIDSETKLADFDTRANTHQSEDRGNQNDPQCNIQHIDVIRSLRRCGHGREL